MVFQVRTGNLAGMSDNGDQHQHDPDEEFRSFILVQDPGDQNDIRRVICPSHGKTSTKVFNHGLSPILVICLLHTMPAGFSVEPAFGSGIGIYGYLSEGHIPLFSAHQIPGRDGDYSFVFLVRYYLPRITLLRVCTMISEWKSHLWNGGIAGLLFFLAGTIVLMGIITAEIFYPAGYSTANSEISDLGATRPPDSISYQPSASIFNMTMIVGGLLIILASSILISEQRRRLILIFPLLLGIGTLGVGIFPGNNPLLHPLFALLTFISGGLSAIISSKIASPPMNYLFGILGIITLIFLFSVSTFIPLLGDGGTERFVAYPVVIWMIGFGGYLAGTRASIERNPLLESES